MIQLRAFGPTNEINALLNHLHALTGIEVSAVSGSMPTLSGTARYYLSAVLTPPNRASHRQEG